MDDSIPSPLLDESALPLLDSGSLNGAGDLPSSEFRDFEIRGRWRDYECAMYVANTGTKIASMHLLDNSQGFEVKVIDQNTTMTEIMDESEVPRSLGCYLAIQLKEIVHDQHYELVTDIYQQVVCKLKSSDSKLQARWELMDANDSTKLMFKKNLLSVHNTWTAYNSSGGELFSLWENHLFSKKTNIHVFCPTAIRALPPLGFVDNDAIQSWAFVDIDAPPPLAIDRNVIEPTNKENKQGEEESKEKICDLRDFEIKGSWSAKNCAMYVADSETKIAQMRARDNAEGFVVEVIGDIQWEFVAACFAAVVAMKIEARKRKEIARHVPGITAKFLGGAVIGAGKVTFDFIYDRS
ncbi:hypothetical protein QVD17_18580 [Tagetes erecta]|uniref:Uncharacterized protein n=1 Tax=Tagetes erecta TaxID=13708 RepID=A0AAD8KN46_TARER|nr:hypothetical protein QVD17_18580 [Tagetes erecta]